jgi:hypothetical protein
MAFPEGPLDFLQDMLGGFTPDCWIVDAFIRTSYSQGDSMCSGTQSFLEEYCECVGSVTESTYSSQEEGPCSLCEDGSPITLPEEELNIEGFHSAIASN